MINIEYTHLRQLQLKGKKGSVMFCIHLVQITHYVSEVYNLTCVFKYYGITFYPSTNLCKVP